MSSPSSRPSLDLSLDTLREGHAHKYQRWVLVGVVGSVLGYSASCLIFTLQQSWGAALASGDPFVVVADLVALALVLRGRARAGALVVLGAAFVDLHSSLLVLRMPTLANVGLVVPAFVLTAGLLFGGHVGIAAACVLALSVPATLWAAALRQPGTGLDDPAVVRFVVVLQVVLWATTALVTALLRTAAEILEQHRESEARARALQAQLLHTQKLEAIGRLAGGVAHDFNNLLTAISGYGSLLQLAGDARAREIGNELLSAQRRGATLTRQLLLVSDVILPGLTGPELARGLKARWPALPCVFVSGYLGDVALGEGFDSASDLVPKPFTSSALLARIASKLTPHQTEAARGSG